MRWLSSVLFLLLGMAVMVVALVERPMEKLQLMVFPEAQSRAAHTSPVLLLSPTEKTRPAPLSQTQTPTPPVRTVASPLDRFDRIYFINLDHRLDRRKEIEAELGYMQVPADKIVRIPGVIPPERRGSIGCTLAHINTLRHFLDHPDQQTAVVLEDDFQFLVTPEQLDESLERFLEQKPEWDVILLAGAVQRSKEYPELPAWRVLSAYTTSGYVVTRTMAAILLANFEEGLAKLREDPKNDDYHLDLYWRSLQPQYQWYMLKPVVGSQRASYSDINHKVKEIKSTVKKSPLTQSEKSRRRRTEGSRSRSKRDRTPSSE